MQQLQLFPAKCISRLVRLTAPRCLLAYFDLPYCNCISCCQPASQTSQGKEPGQHDFNSNLVGFFFSFFGLYLCICEIHSQRQTQYSYLSVGIFGGQHCLRFQSVGIKLWHAAQMECELGLRQFGNSATAAVSLYQLSLNVLKSIMSGCHP